MSRRPVELLRYDADALDRVAFARAWERGIVMPPAPDARLALVLESLGLGSPALGHTSYTLDLAPAGAPGHALRRPDGTRVLVTLTLAEVRALVAAAGPLADAVATAVEAVHPYFVLPRTPGADIEGVMQMTPDQEQEIRALRETKHETRRPTVPALEEVLFVPVPVLDHGFVRVIDYMGDDAAIVQAARVSYGKGTKKVSEDRGLIRYLMRHRHTTPFEMCELKLHCKMPIFVARQWIRHRAASVNEYSARYSILDREFYLPRPEDLGVQATANRQGRGEVLPPERAAEVMRLLREDATRSYDHYQDMLNLDDQGNPVRPDEPGLARELARMNLTLAYYTQWYWKIDLHNLLHFLSLRIDDHAQHEIRVYAEAIADFTRRWVPNAWEAFVDYRLESTHVSRAERAALREMMTGRKPDLAALGLSKREIEEFEKKFA